MLEAVRVTGRELCPGSPERGAAFALWDQARAGLLAAIVTREAKPADANMLSFERTVSPGDEVVQRMRVETRSGRTTRPFVSPLSPTTLAQHGYLQEADDGSRVFVAPDADVLLDESFASVHCFHLQSADAEHRGEIGLAFAPIAAHDTMVDVAGVIWMDAAQPALRTLDFRYTSLEPAARDANAGGDIHFRTMPNGVSFIDRWALRLPALSMDRPRDRTVRDPAHFRERRATNFAARVSAIVETGGQVLDATWGDGIAWRAANTAIHGRLTSAGRPAAGAVVALEGTSYHTVADAAGAFALDHVVPGKYTLVATDTTLLAYIEERRATQSVRAVRDSVTQLALVLPRFAEIVERLCRGQEQPRNTAILLGQIVNERGVPDPTVHVAADWLADVNRGVPVDAGRALLVDKASRDVDLDDQGRFTLCGVAPERPIHLRASRGRASADTTIKVPEDSTFKTLRWDPHLADGAPHR